LSVYGFRFLERSLGLEHKESRLVALRLARLMQELPVAFRRWKMEWEKAAGESGPLQYLTLAPIEFDCNRRAEDQAEILEADQEYEPQKTGRHPLVPHCIFGTPNLSETYTFTAESKRSRSVAVLTVLHIELNDGTTWGELMVKAQQRLKSWHHKPSVMKQDLSKFSMVEASQLRYKMPWEPDLDYPKRYKVVFDPEVISSLVRVSP
jgi:hypothetical protein